MEKALVLVQFGFFCLCIATVNGQLVAGPNCTFNSGNCDYHPTSPKTTGWKNIYGTVQDGAKGRFLFFNASNYNRGHVAEVQAPLNLFRHDYCCIRFFYSSWMPSQRDTTVMSVGYYGYDDRQKVFDTFRDNTQSRWRKTVIRTYLFHDIGERLRLYFSVKKTGDYKSGYFAIDDVLVYPIHRLESCR